VPAEIGQRWIWVSALIPRELPKDSNCWVWKRRLGLFICSAKCFANLGPKIPMPALSHFFIHYRPSMHIARFPPIITGEVESVMTPAMGIESRRAPWTGFSRTGCVEPVSRITALNIPPGLPKRGYLVKGKVDCSAAWPCSFVAPVPIYSGNGDYLGRVIASRRGNAVPFQFPLVNPGNLSSIRK